MKVGYRKPSIKKSVKARTTGKAKRKVKKAVNPLYGKKGMGYIKNPSKAVKSKVYHKTTFGISDIFKATKSSGKKKSKQPLNDNEKTLIALIFFFPVGLYFLWAKCTWKKWVKIAITVFFAILMIIAIL